MYIYRQGGYLDTEEEVKYNIRYHKRRIAKFEGKLARVRTERSRQFWTRKLKEEHHFLDGCQKDMDAAYEAVKNGLDTSTEDNKITNYLATKLANDALKTVTVTREEIIAGEVYQDGPVNVWDTTVLYLSEDGTYCVTDNGGSVDGLDAEQALRIMVESLTT